MKDRGKIEKEGRRWERMAMEAEVRKWERERKKQKQE
jgi:hypothetical protein